MSGALPDPGERGVRRYSARPFPTYRYVPRVEPHPTRDARGHSYMASATPRRPGQWVPDEWRDLDDWLYGVDLFNRFYFWEAHEAWEGLWAAAPRQSPPALLLQGLIQIAAALLKTHLGVLAGARLLSVEGLAKLRRVAAQQPVLLGLDVVDALTRIDAYFAPTAHDVLPAIDARVPLLRLRAD